MKTNVEKQVAAFDQVLGHCNALGPMYNPSTESIKVTALTSVLTSAQVFIKAVDTAKSNLIQAINERQLAFSPLTGIGTRILNALQATDASPQLIADIKKYRDKLRGSGYPGHVSRTQPEDSSTTQTTSAKPPRKSLSELDYESRIRNFSIMIDLLTKEPAYNPNEADISIAGLNALLESLHLKNKEVNDAKVALSNARMIRNEAVYGDKGVYGSGKRVKKYVLSAFGATSKQYHQFNGYSFKSR